MVLLAEFDGINLTFNCCRNVAFNFCTNIQGDSFTHRKILENGVSPLDRFPAEAAHATPRLGSGTNFSREAFEVYGRFRAHL